MAKSLAAEPDDAKGPDDTPELLEPKESGGRRKMILIIAPPVALLAIGAGLWFSGLLGTQHAEDSAEQAGPSTPIYVDLPEMITNLNTHLRPPPRYVKLTVRL